LASVIVKTIFFTPEVVYFTEDTLAAFDVAGLAPEPKFQLYVAMLEAAAAEDCPLPRPPVPRAAKVP
jgi:hypothetical protein